MRNFENHFINSNISFIGKLPNSSYYEKSSKVLNPKTQKIEEIPQVTSLQERPIIHDQNLFVRSCIFSRDNSHLAWTCGYKIVKIMKFKASESLKRSCSEMNNDEARTAPVNLEENDIVEIECNENVKALAFGSSKSEYSQRSVHYRTKKEANTRFEIGVNNLLLAVGLATGKIKLYDVSSLTLIMNLNDHQNVINDLKFTNDGSLQLMSASSDETIKLWNIYQDGNMYKTFRGHIGKVNMCDWSPVSKLICSVGQNRQAYIWDTQSFKLKYTLRGHLHNVSSCLFSPDGALVATACYDTKICIWNPYSGELIKQFAHMLPPPSLIYAGGDNGAYIRDLSFSSEGDHLVSICDDKKIRIWSMTSRTIFPIAVGEMRDIGLSCAYSSSNRTIMVGTRYGYVDTYKTHDVNIPKLVDLCKKIVNKRIIQPVTELDLPNELKKFLTYDNIRDFPVRKPAVTPAFMSSMMSGSNVIVQGTTLCN